MQPDESLKVARTDCLPRRPELEMNINDPFVFLVFFGSIVDLHVSFQLYYFFIIILKDNTSK